MRHNLLVWSVLLGVGAGTTGCGEGEVRKTVFQLRIERGNAPGPIKRIDLSITKGSTTFTWPVEEDSEIALPHTEPVTLPDDQSGRVLVHATAFDAAGTEVAAGSQVGDIVPGETLVLTLVFGQFAMEDVDGGLDVDAAPPDAALSEAMLTVTPTTGDLGSVVIGAAPASATFTVKNEGEQASGLVTLALSGADAAAFTIDPASTCTGAVLAPGASCEVGVGFAPTAAGTRSASLDITATPGGALAVPLTASGLTPGQLTIMPGSRDFGGVVTGGNSAATVFTVSNSGGVPTGAIAVSFGGTGAARFNTTANTCAGMTLAPGATCTISARFSPTTVGVQNAMLVATATPGGSATAALTGRGLAPAQLVIAPTAADFGTVVQAGTADQVFAVSNGGGVATGVPAAALGGAAAGDYSITANTCTAALAPAARCSITVHFVAGTLGTRAATLTVTGTPGGAPSATLTASTVAPGALAIAPAARDFGNVLVGQVSTNQTFTVSNTGGAPTGLPTVALGGSGAGQFTIVTNGCGAVLAPAATCAVVVRFAPSAAGARAASLSVSGVPGGTASAALRGNGQDPALLVADATTQAFGTVDVTQTASFTWTLTNTGDVPTGVPALTTTGATTQYQITNSCGAALAGGASCTIVVRFAPTAAGAQNVNLSVSATPGGTVALAVTGTGRALVAVTVARAGNGSGTFPAQWDPKLGIHVT